MEQLIKLYLACTQYVPGVSLAVILCFCSTWEEGSKGERSSYDGEEEAEMTEIYGAAICLHSSSEQAFPGKQVSNLPGEELVCCM